MSVLVVSAAATWAMAGVIWTMQLVHYPQLGELSALRPATAAANHQRRITWVVGPLMAAEGVTALMLLFARPSTMSTASAWAAAALLGLALASTVLVQVPHHGRLSAGHDDGLVRDLIRFNWIRTAAWTMRAVLLAAVIAT